MPDLKLAVVGATGAVGPEVLRVLEQRKFPRPRSWPSPRPGRRARGWRLPAPSSRCANSPPMPWRGSIWRCSRPGRAPPARSPRSGRARMCGGRQVQCVSHGSRGAAGRSRGQCHGDRLPQRHRREPELLDDPVRGGAQAAAGCGRPQPRHRGDLSSGQRHRHQGDGRAGGPDARGDRGRAGRGDRLPASDRVNALPHCDVFDDDGNTQEETKLVRESRKILAQPALADLGDMRSRSPSCVGIRRRSGSRRPSRSHPMRPASCWLVPRAFR